MLPSPPLAVRMSPFGASVIPSGPFRAPPDEHGPSPPPVAGKKRNGASGIAGDPAVHRVGDIQGSVTPESDAGGPDARARPGRSRSANPVAITSSSSTTGRMPGIVSSWMRTTVPRSTTWPVMLESRRRRDGAVEHVGHVQRREEAVIDRGHVPRPVDRTAGDRFDHLPVAVEHEQASGLGGRRLCRPWSGGCPRSRSRVRVTASAVVSPTPPGHGPGSAFGSICANTDARVRGATAGWDLDDRRAGALLVGGVVEVADEHVAALQRPDAPWHGHDAVRVHVAVRRHRGRDRGAFGMNPSMNGLACAAAAPSANHPHRHTSVGRTARLPVAASRASAPTARGCELGG